MRPLRRHRRFAWLALLAFAAQIVLSFGHMHDAASPVHASKPAANCLLHEPCSPSEPAEHHHFCPLCWALSAAGSFILPQPILLGLPIVCLQLSVPPPPAKSAAAVETPGFQARAPPVFA
jgi:hypothetical protein